MRTIQQYVYLSQDLKYGTTKTNIIVCVGYNSVKKKKKDNSSDIKRRESKIPVHLCYKIQINCLVFFPMS